MTTRLERRHPGRLVAAAALYLVASVAPSQAQPPLQAPRPLLVMLQGPDSNAIAAALTASGARITHRLPIINAMAAQMSPAQLNAVRAAVPGITRVIDDLAWEPAPELGANPRCPLGAALELHWQGSTAQWRLFNRDAGELELGAGSLSWPAALGPLQGIRFAGEALTPTLAEQADPTVLSASWQHSVGTPIAANSSALLELEFSNAPDSAPQTQNALTLEVEQSAECKATLIPSYRHPDQDSYYPTVSGAALLHSHGITGAGVTVAVLDSGLWEGHPEIAQDTQGRQRVKARYDAILDEEPAQLVDESGHGTHMASVVARSGRVTRSDAQQPSYRGIAPDASLVAVKAIGASGEAGFLDLVRGIQWVVDNRERLDIKVLNLSFASRPRWPYWDDPVNQALMRAWEAGIFIAAAAGNEGPEPMSVGSPGNLPYLLTVGAMTDSWSESDSNDDYIPDFSSRGPTPMGHIKPDLVAPGGHIAGIVSPNSELQRRLPEYMLSSGEFVMTGTSQATALVSGLAALLLQLDPGISNNELKCALKTSAQPAIEQDGRLAYSPFVQGSGLVSVARALTIGARACDQNQLNLTADMAGIDHFEGPAIFSPGEPPRLPEEAALISSRPSEKGFSPTRRWGVEQHLERLTEPPKNWPINWLSIYLDEQRKIEALTEKP